MKQFNDPVKYLAALNNETDNAHIQIVRDWIKRARSVRDDLSKKRPKRRQRMTTRIAKLIECRDDLLAGRPNAFWHNQKQKTIAAIADDIALGIQEVE
jgi:hypothetical protein